MGFFGGMKSFFGDLKKIGKTYVDSNNGMSAVKTRLGNDAVIKNTRNTLYNFRESAAPYLKDNRDLMPDFKEARKTVIEAIKPENMTTKDMAYSLLQDKNGKFSYGRAAAAGLTTYGALNVPYRLISGGGLAYDNNGNTDIIGVPFI